MKKSVLPGKITAGAAMMMVGCYAFGATMPPVSNACPSINKVIVKTTTGGELDDAHLIGTTDKPRAIDYEAGETMRFTLTLKNAKPYPAGAYFVKWTRTGDDGKSESGKEEINPEKPVVVKTSLAEPGFVRLTAEVVDSEGMLYRKQLHVDTSTPEGRQILNRWERHTDKRVFFDGGAAVHPEKLQSVPEPSDFDAFWAKRKARLAKVPLKPVLTEQKSSNPKVKVYTFSVPCAGPRPVTGKLTMPTAPGKYPASIGFHGYWAHYIQNIPSSGPEDRIDVFINAHGYELGREAEYYTEFYSSIKSNGKTFGLDSTWQNKSTDTAYFGWMCYRIMRALQFIKSLPEWNGKDIRAYGGSMGGLQAIWAAGLDPDVSEANPGKPWCCDMGGRETLKRNGITWGVGETEAMRYFDPVNLARRISKKCKLTITRAGLGDYCCPPSGIAVFYNNLSCDKTINWVQGATHGHVPPEGFGNQKFTLHEPAR